MGYAMGISLNTYSAIESQKQVKLYVYEAIREDAHQLFGFATKKERELFMLLISVSGIGANTARMVLSSMTLPLHLNRQREDDKKHQGYRSQDRTENNR